MDDEYSSDDKMPEFIIQSSYGSDSSNNKDEDDDSSKDKDEGDDTSNLLPSTTQRFFMQKDEKDKLSDLSWGNEKKPSLNTRVRGGGIRKRTINSDGVKGQIVVNCHENGGNILGTTGVVNWKRQKEGRDHVSTYAVVNHVNNKWPFQFVVKIT
eukprot:9595349-Ditylum_brightwellii.AAC.1